MNSSRSQAGDAPSHDDADSPFRIKASFNGPIRQRLLSPSYRLAERMLFLKHLDQLYSDIRERDGEEHFLIKMLEEMNVTYKISDEDFARMPVDGPAIVVANHPYGGIEAAIMVVALRSLRTDSKVLSNYFLSRIPEVHDVSIFVNPFGGKESVKANIAPLKEAAKWVKSGGMLGTFPSGEVSHLSLRGRGVIDSSWNAHIGRIIRMTKAPVVPMFIEGHNGPLFQMAGMIHPRLRTAMLPHELINKRDHCIRVAVGNVIPHEKLSSYSSDADMMNYLRFRTYVLENRHDDDGTKRKTTASRRPQRKDQEIAPPENPNLMQAEIAQLPKEQKLTDSREFAVYIARAEQVRHVLHEIGRLREITFRQEREGTGKPRDLDRFDEHYLHLFVWNTAKNEVVGSYRIGCTDDIVARFGKKGLYTSTLFRYKKRLLTTIDPALELGRSFVRPEYQKNYSPLLLLWKGIGQFVVQNPRYKNLFGPVSISNDYSSVSRNLLAMYLKYTKSETQLARMIRAKRPLRRKRIKACASTIFDSGVTDIDTISAVISEIEEDHKGVPILIKQYLRMGGRLLGFNMDPDFGNVLDGLILVDLVQTDPKQVERFMGKEGYKSFVSHHSNSADEPGPQQRANGKTTRKHRATRQRSK